MCYLCNVEQCVVIYEDYYEMRIMVLYVREKGINLKKLI